MCYADLRNRLRCRFDPDSCMKLPNADTAMVERKKVVDYLLALDHSSGRSKAMIEELSDVVLTTDVDAQGLRVGDIGTVVLVHANGAAFEVEFITLGGDTLAVLTLSADQVRAVDAREIAHVRKVA